MPSVSRNVWVELSIEGVSDAELHPYLASLTYKESKDSLDSLEATVNVPEGSERHAIRQKLLVPGATWRLSFHRGVAPVREVSGDIVAVRHQKTIDGRWTLALTGLEVLHRLKGATLSAVSDDGLGGLLAEVAQSYRLRAREEGRSLNEDQPIVLDAEVLALLKTYADGRGCYLTTDDTGRVVIRDRGSASGTARVRWGEDVESISLAMDLSGLPTRVTVHGLDHESGDPENDPTSTASRLEGRQRGGQTGIALRKKLWGELEALVYPWSIVQPVFPAGTTGDVGSHAEWALQSAADAYVRGSVTVRGCPEASKDASLTIEDAPWPLSGTFVIEDATHSYTADEGLTSELEFFSDSVAAKRGGPP